MVSADRAAAQVTCTSCTGGIPCPNPSICTQSRGFADIGTVGALPFVVSGQPICYQVSYGNNPANLPDACDVTGATVVLVCPNANGIADQANGSQVITLVSNTSFPANGTANVFNQGADGTLCCNPVMFNPGVTVAQGAVFGGSPSDCNLGEVHLAIPQSFSVTKSAATPVLTCDVQVDKQVSCDGGATFHDVGFVSADTDSSDFCLGWSAHDTVPAENIIVRYAVKNNSTSGLVLHNCSIVERNTAITGSTITVGDVVSQTPPFDVTNPCSAALSANEPDRATVTCDCTSTPGMVQVSAFDEAKFACQTPGVTVVKTCPPTGAVLCGDSATAAFTVTVHNSGMADLASCTVTDTAFPGDTSCTNNGTSVTVTPSTIASLPAGGQDVTSTGTVTLSADSCNRASVTCNIVGSAGPKTITASDQTTCMIPCFTTTTSTTTTTTLTTTSTTTTTTSTSTTTTTTMPCPPGGGGFAFLVRTRGQVGNGSQVLASFGANEPGGGLQFGSNTFVSDGSTVAGDFVNLSNNDNVFNVLANHLRKGSRVNIRGSVGTPVLPLTSPFCPIPTIDCDGAPDRLVPAGNVVTLTPNTYGRLLLQNGADVVLSGPGTFTFCAIQTGANANILVKGAGVTTLDVAGGFRLADGGFLGPDTGVPTPILNVGGTSFRLGRRSSIQAFISAPRANASLGKGTKITGTFCFNSTRSDKAITMMCPMP